jgi:hypothetical protein
VLCYHPLGSARRMKNDILSRYDRDPDGRIVIGVLTESCDALFNAYDFVSTLTKRDLKPDFAEYLVESVEEIGLGRKFVIRVTLPEVEAHSSAAQRLDEAVRGYFGYRIVLARNSVRATIGRILINLALALGVLVLIFVLERGRARSGSIWSRIFFEGLYIAVWVLMWPLFSEFLFDLRTNFRKIRLYRRIIAAQVEVRIRPA